ncbi:hypothetical protein LIA77_09638 [Sarocladium implicatum]|nr:hypothetical protein LIA77_09638 [Sarocladium implicatum]
MFKHHRSCDTSCKSSIARTLFSWIFRVLLIVSRLSILSLLTEEIRGLSESFASGTAVCQRLPHLSELATYRASALVTFDRCLLVLVDNLSTTFTTVCRSGSF